MNLKNKNMINIKETFLKLTLRRYPNGTEDLAMDIVKEMLPNIIFDKDEFGNYFVNILKDSGDNSDTMFTSHLDTIDSGPFSYNSNKIWDKDKKIMVPNPLYKENGVDNKSITHVMDGDFVKTDGTTNLGADDKAGTTIMINLINENVPGLYYFFVGEESGCIGSSALSRVFISKGFQEINRCISFDRRGYDSVITHQHGICCSDTFANDLANKLNEYGFWYKPDPTGIYTDSAEFVDIVPECTNLSVGYFSEHTKTEKQDLEFLELLAIVCTKIEWDTLPTVRNKTLVYTGKKYSARTYGTPQSYGGYNYYDDYDYYENKNNVPKKKSTPKIEENKSVKNDNNILDFEFNKWYEEQKNLDWV